jgi:hypothetical protein
MESFPCYYNLKKWDRIKCQWCNRKSSVDENLSHLHDLLQFCAQISPNLNYQAIPDGHIENIHTTVLVLSFSCFIFLNRIYEIRLFWMGLAAI